MFPPSHSMLSVYRYIDVHVRKTHMWLTFDKRSKTIGTTKSQVLIFASLFCTSSSKTQRNYEKNKFLLAVPSVTGNCSPPFESFFSTCITHVSRSQTPFNSYADMRQICHFIGGHLYKIQVDHRLKEDWVKSYSWGKTYYLPYIFMPRDGRSGAYCFCPAIIRSFLHSVILWFCLKHEPCQ